MRVEILSCAEAELAEAVDYYNHQCAGLGYEFAAAVKATFDRISAFPSAWPAFSKQTRRCMANQFPYGVLYQSRPDCILVLAIMHMKRDPIRWQDKLRAGSGRTLRKVPLK